MHKILEVEERINLIAELKSEKYRKHADRIRVILLLDDEGNYFSSTLNRSIF